MTDYFSLIRRPQDILKLTALQFDDLQQSNIDEIADRLDWTQRDYDLASDYACAPRIKLDDGQTTSNGKAHGEEPFIPPNLGDGVDARAGEPLPLFPPLGEASPYPVEALGPTLSRAAAAIANRSQVATSMAAQSVLAAASLAACPHADVMLPYGQSRPLALFFATIAESGARKTSSDEEALWPVRTREKILREVYQDEMRIWQVAHAAWSAEKRKIEADRKIDLAERKALLTALGAGPPKPLYPYLTSGDLTIEGVVKNWPDAHPALGLFTAEGATFTAGHGMNDDNRLKTAGMLSELWDGRPVKRIRAMDGVTILPGRRLALHVMIQPDVAAAFLCDESLRDQGLLSRILIAAPASLAGTRTYRAPDPKDGAAIRAYGARILSLLETPPALEPGTRNELLPPALPISEAATNAWVDFYNRVEERCGTNADLSSIGDFAAKAAEHAARIAGVITIIENIYAKEIAEAAMTGALKIMHWHINEAFRLKEAGRTDPRLLRANALLKWIREQPKGQIGFRELLQFGPNAARTKAAANEALNILKDHGWITEISERPRVIKAFMETK